MVTESQNQADRLFQSISTNQEIQDRQETLIARTLICNYENFIIALLIFKTIPDAPLEDKRDFAEEWKGRISEARIMTVGPLPPAYDPVWLECLQAIGSATIFSPNPVT